MSSVEIRPVRSRRELKRFVKLPFRLHRNSPQWVAPLIYERMEFLNREKNPWFEHGEAEYLIAECDGEPVGRITAQIDELWEWLRLLPQLPNDFRFERAPRWAWRWCAWCGRQLRCVGALATARKKRALGGYACC